LSRARRALAIDRSDEHVDIPSVSVCCHARFATKAFLSRLMFTGIVEETGEVISLRRAKDTAQLVVFAPSIGPKTAIGESVAVNGCCLTIARRDGADLLFDLLGETLDRTNLGDLKPSSLVNIERALPANGRLGGHFVQGHVDCTCRVLAFEKTGADYRLAVELPAEFARYVAFKGSIAINGISLTVAEVSGGSLAACIIPHTLTVTNLRGLKAGDRANVEFDLLAKYVERMMEKRES
jgi:riboflavin synthase